jgi:hypothetical protein
MDEIFSRDEIVRGIEEIIADLKRVEGEDAERARWHLQGVTYLLEKAPAFQVTLSEAEIQNMGALRGLVPKGKRGC